MHDALYIERSARTLVLFVHGFLGSPDQFSYLAGQAYASGASVQTLLLPGHGGSVRDFRKTTRSQWSAYVQDVLRERAKQYRTIIIAAHSMGCLLAVNAAVRSEYNVRGLFLIAPAVKLRIWSAYTAVTFLRTTFAPSTNTARSLYSAYSSVKNARLHPFSMLRPYNELRKLTSETLNNLPLVTVPVTLVFSKRDETVSYGGTEIMLNGLKKAANVRLITLERSLHAYIEDSEKQTAAFALRELLKQFSM